MLDANAAEIWLAIVSGVPLVLLGLVALPARSRPGRARAFGAFCVLWGGLAITGNVARLFDGSVGRAWTLAYLAFISLAWVPLLLFAARQARGDDAPPRRAPELVLLALGLVGPASLPFWPKLLYGTPPPPGDTVQAWGPLYLVYAPLFLGAMFYACHALAAGASRAERWMALGLSIYLAYWSTEVLVSYGLELGAGLLDAAFQAQAIVFVLVALAGLALLARDALRARGERRVLSVLAAPLAAGALSGYTIVYPASPAPMDTLGFWRIVATSLLAYAIVRHGHFELAPRYRRAIGFSLVTLLGVASAFGIEQAAEHASGSAGMALLLTELYIAGVLGVLAYRFRRRLSEALTTPPRGAAGVAREPAPGERIDGYVIERPLGAGSSGRAFLARDDLLRRSVVLKLLAPQDTATFLEEARFLAAMDHPRLVRIHGAGSWLGSPYLVLAHAPGGSLADRLREGPLPAGEAARLMDDALSALAYLHERGLVHGDVKPANVLLDANGRALLADLGAASRSRTTQRSLAPPAASHALGTPAYLSPEARAGALPTPGRDVFAAGVMLAEMLGPGGGGPLARVAARATRGDPADRYADAGAMREALRRAEDEERAAHAHDVAVR